MSEEKKTHQEEVTEEVETKAVTITEQADYLPAVRSEIGMWQLMNSQAKVFLASGALPAAIKNLPQVVMILQSGREVGLQPTAALRSFYFVNGRLSMWGSACIGLARKAGHTVIFSNCTNESATCTIKRGDNGQEMTETATMADHRNRKQTGNDVWTKHPKRMLKYKAFHEVANFLISEVYNGIPIEGQIESGDYVEQTPLTEEIEIESRPTDEGSTLTPSSTLTSNAYATAKEVKSAWAAAQKRGWPDDVLDDLAREACGLKGSEKWDMTFTLDQLIFFKDTTAHTFKDHGEGSDE